MKKTSMFPRLWFFAVAAALSGFAGVVTPTPVSAGPAYSTAADADLNVRIDWRDNNYRSNNRICCKRGYRDWWSDWRSCRRAGGHATANRACRDDRADNWGARVCCQRGRGDWWSTQRECRRNGGHVTYPRACRNDRDNRPYGYNTY